MSTMNKLMKFQMYAAAFMAGLSLITFAAFIWQYMMLAQQPHIFEASHNKVSLTAALYFSGFALVAFMFSSARAIEVFNQK